MKRTMLNVSLAAIALCATTAIVFAQDTTKKAPPANSANSANSAQSADSAESHLPPGMTQADMDAAMAAATPGPMHEYLCSDAGSWSGECKMWMAPGTEPIVCISNYVQTPMLSGRFIQQVVKSDMGQWGLFEGLGTVGYDNAKGEFQAWWIDSMGTGMSYGTGSLSADKKVLTINYGFFCPMQKKNCTFRQTVTRNDDGSRTMRMFVNAPDTGKEFMMMETNYKRTGTSAGASAG